MGADVHMYVEYNSKERLPHANPAFNSWRSFGDRINPGRNYNLFGLLAGVRCEGEIFAVRGLPENLGWSANGDSTLYITESGDDDGCCTLGQAESYEKWGSTIHKDANGKPTKVDHPDWHSHSWLTVDELQQVFDAYFTKHGQNVGVEYRALLSAMRALENEGKNDVRVVFWFDN